MVDALGVAAAMGVSEEVAETVPLPVERVRSSATSAVYAVTSRATAQKERAVETWAVAVDIAAATEAVTEAETEVAIDMEEAVVAVATEMAAAAREVADVTVTDDPVRHITVRSRDPDRPANWHLMRACAHTNINIIQ